MELTNLSSELALAKKAAEVSGQLLQDKKKQFNEVLSSNSKDIKLLTDNGIRTFLIGEIFMRQDCPGQALKKLLSSCAESD